MTPIDFGLRDCSDYNDIGRKQWWESMRPWFAEKGYILYQSVYEGDSIRDEPSFVFSGETQFPYAYDGGCPEEGCTLYRDMHPRIVYAQDALLRHVAIKVVVTDSDEYRILCLLRQLQPRPLNFQKFTSVMPIIDMLPFGAHHFIIMPRWGTRGALPWFETMEEALDWMRSLLVGLTFLHENRIFHRDINGANILVNHFVCEEYPDYNEVRRTLRSQKRLCFALNDFDLAVLFPPDTNIRDCRLPIIFARGLHDKPPEVLSGEIDFNPFAYDVASLGIEFVDKYKHLCPTVPMLAPLLSGMVRHDIANRFTAKEALEFLDELRAGMSQDDLSQTPEPLPDYTPWTGSDWWANVPPHLARKWDRYRPKPESFFVASVLRPLCERRWGVYLVHYTRLLLSPMSLWRYGWKAFLC